MPNLHTTVLTDPEKKARIILDRTYDAFVEIDTNNIIVDWNTRAEIIFGWTREQAIGKNICRTYYPN